MPAPRSLSCMRDFLWAVHAGVMASALTFPVSAGVVIGGTRIVFNESQGSATFSVKNTEQMSYLVKSEVKGPDAWTGGMTSISAEVPFIATPPLFVLPGGKENRVRIIKTDGSLPVDRESLFQLEVAAIPPGKVAPDSLHIAIRTRLKLIWRPSGLRGKSEQAYRKILWRQMQGAIVAENPTPYVVTLFNVRINGTKTDSAGVVMPFSSRTVAKCPALRLCVLEWQSVNDYGRIMPAIHVDVDEPPVKKDKHGAQE